MRFGFLLLAVLLALPAGAATLSRDFSFPAGDFDVSDMDGRALVTGVGMDVTDEPGKPQLPVRPVALELDGNCVVRAVRVTASNWTGLDTDAEPFPCQRQVVLSRTDLAEAFTPPDPAVYGSHDAWPAVAGRWTGTGRRGENTVVDLLLHPVRRAAGLLERCGRIRVEVDYDRLPPLPALDVAAFEYVIVTSAAYDSIFQRLADWKTRKGVPAVIRHIDWVYANYTGRDNAEKLRNYIRTLPDSGARYVLLGGDVSVVPFRKAFAMVSEGNIHNREDSLPCDLYFADLDGDWDFNGNNVFGEAGDSVDLYPDLYVGRAPVDSRQDAQAFVNKVLEYEQSPAMPRQRNALFFAEVMWTNPYTDGGVHKDRLEAKSFTGHDVTKKYERMGNESRASVMAAIRDGQNCLNHDGHGWIDVMSCGGYPNYLRTRDGDTITNAYKGIMFSIGCWTTAFDEVSIGEAFVTNPNGGAAALVGNSSYGWGSPGNPGFGYSDKFDDKFWAMIQNEGEVRVGAALAEAKAWFAPFSRGRNVYRWHQYQLNLMGCPEMPAWTAVPDSMRISAPAEVPPRAGRVLVTVLDILGEPVEGALVCLMKGEESYARTLTGTDGAAWLEVTPATGGSFDLTVTARDRLPWQGTIPVGSGAWVNFAGWTIDDSAGNGDGIANPGEAIRLPVLMHNAGEAMSGPKEIVLRSIDPCVVITDSLGSVCELAPGESLAIADAFAVSVLMCPRDGHGLRFDLVVRDPEYGEEQVFYPVILVGRPNLAFERYWLLDPPLLPAGTGELRVCVQNGGYGWGHETWATLRSLDPDVTVLEPESLPVGEVAPRDRRAPADSFRVSVDPGCPASYLAPMELVTRTGDIEFRDTFNLLVGNFGFADDIESGDSKWTHGGSGDRWHISTYRANTGTHSWYCGDSVSRRYSANMNSWLETDEFMVAENCSLKFWRWFSVPNYGVDGIYVIVRRGAVSETLDFIGTGGALEDRGQGEEPGPAPTLEPWNPGTLEPSPLGIESDWFQEKFDLSHIPAGETISIRIGFKSDSEDNDEGFYIDDFEVTGNVPPLLGVTREGARTRLTAGLSLAPNPLRGGFATLRYSLPQAGPA
ncbi:hypothetical protein JXB37_02185, partial [candidate division WOR-3 bacterium]|nr:hypothetical protein [candidate division WOR-3 bacterium]